MTVERSGRHRYYRLASEHVGTILEALAAIAPTQPVRSLQQPRRRPLLRFCLDWNEQHHRQRAVALTDTGAHELRTRLGVRWT